MTLAQYIRTKGHKLTVRRLAELSLYSESGLWKMYNRDPALIDELLERYSDSITVSGIYQGSTIGGGTVTRSKRVKIERDKWRPVK